VAFFMNQVFWRTRIGGMATDAGAHTGIAVPSPSSPMKDVPHPPPFTSGAEWCRQPKESRNTSAAAKLMALWAPDRTDPGWFWWSAEPDLHRGACRDYHRCLLLG